MSDTPRPMRIGYVIQQFPPEVGAGAARVTEMATRWIQWGADVTVITGIPSRTLPQRLGSRADDAYRGVIACQETWRGIRVLRSWLYTSRRTGIVRTVVNNGTFMASSALHAAVRLGSVDVLIASSPPFLPHVSGALIAAAKRCPLVLEIRDLWPDYMVELGILRRGSTLSRLLFALERRLLSRAAHIVVITDSFRQKVEAKGVASEKITILPNGVDLSRYYASSEPFPIDIPRATDSFTVGYLGTFGAGQRLSSVVDAAQILAREEPGARFVLVGDGPDGDRVRERARRANLANLSVHPPIDRELTRAFYNGCDVCLIPLAPVDVLASTVPSKLFEVMACGRPVVGSVRGETERIIRESGCGLAVSPGDPRAIANGVIHMMRTSASERAALGEHARRYVADRYDRVALARRFLDLLQDIGSGAVLARTRLAQA